MVMARPSSGSSDSTLRLFVFASVALIPVLLLGVVLPVTGPGLSDAGCRKDDPRPPVGLRQSVSGTLSSQVPFQAHAPRARRGSKLKPCIWETDEDR
jgi:hypothetical protein